MGFDGRVSRPISGERRKNRTEKNSPQIDWVHLEQRRSLFDELYNKRFDAIDDLPSQKIMHGDPNYYKYKCRTNWMFGLSFKLDAAVRNGVLVSPQEVEIVKNFQQFIRDLKVRQQNEIQQKITDEDRVYIKSLFEKSDFQNAEKFIKETYWVPVKPEDIDFINRTLDGLLLSLSYVSRKKQNSDDQKAA